MFRDVPECSMFQVLSTAEGGGGGRGVKRTNEQTRPQKEKKKTAIAKPLQDDK